MFSITWVSQLMTLGRLNTHITYMLVSELAQFISLETELCLLRDLNVTNNGFEHVLYPLLKRYLNDIFAGWLASCKLWLWADFRGGSGTSDWVRRVSSLGQILEEKNLNSKQSSGGCLKTFGIALILIFQVASQKSAVFFFTDVCKEFRDICEEEHCRLLDSSLKY